MKDKVIVITGASSGIGEALAVVVAARYYSAEDVATVEAGPPFTLVPRR